MDGTQHCLGGGTAHFKGGSRLVAPMFSMRCIRTFEVLAVLVCGGLAEEEARTKGGDVYGEDPG